MSWKAARTIILILSDLYIFYFFDMHHIFFYLVQYSCYVPSQETSINHFRIPFNKQIFNYNEKLLRWTVLAYNSFYKIFFSSMS